MVMTAEPDSCRHLVCGVDSFEWRARGGGGTRQAGTVGCERGVRGINSLPEKGLPC